MKRTALLPGLRYHALGGALDVACEAAVCGFFDAATFAAALILRETPADTRRALALTLLVFALAAIIARKFIDEDKR